jgi:hypothetical protein
LEGGQLNISNWKQGEMSTMQPVGGKGRPGKGEGKGETNCLFLGWQGGHPWDDSMNGNVKSFFKFSFMESALSSFPGGTL